jgi:dGTPase
LNEDLAEAIALAHDLGHSPFGHSGEEMLAECMQNHGGFDHNRQSVRVVELLETPYPDFPGLNLTFEVGEGLRKHERTYEFPPPAAETYNFPSLEAQVADRADEITYYSHDLDDAIDFEILGFAQLEDNAVWRNSHRAVRARYTAVGEPNLHKLIIRDIIDNEVHDLVSNSAKFIAESGVQGADEVRRQRAPLIRYSNELAEANHALRKFLYQNVYYHPQVSKLNRRACEMLRRLFQFYISNPDRFRETVVRRTETESLHRIVCDYVAGMTDRYLMEEYARITDRGALVGPSPPI